MCADQSDRRHYAYPGVNPGSYLDHSASSPYTQDSSSSYRRNSVTSGGGGRNRNCIAPDASRRTENTRFWYSSGRDQANRFEHKRFKLDPSTNEFVHQQQSGSQNGWSGNNRSGQISGSGTGGSYGRPGFYQTKRNPTHYQKDSFPPVSVAAGRPSGPNHYNQRFNYGPKPVHFDDCQTKQNQTNINFMKKPPKIYQKPKHFQQEQQQPKTRPRQRVISHDDRDYKNAIPKAFPDSEVTADNPHQEDSVRQSRQEKRPSTNRTNSEEQFRNDKSKKKPRRKTSKGPPPQDQVDLVVHHLILFFASELSNYGECSVDNLLETHRANSAPHRALKQVVKSDSQKVGIHSFLLQHPAIFTVLDFGARVHLTPMTDDLDEQLQASSEQRMIDYLRLW